MSNANQPAFPTSEFYDEKVIGTVGGLTKRELFAAMAMQGCLADPKIRGDLDLLAPVIAQESVAFADALLAELAKS